MARGTYSTSPRNVTEEKDKETVTKAEHLDGLTGARSQEAKEEEIVQFNP